MGPFSECRMTDVFKADRTDDQCRLGEAGENHVGRMKSGCAERKVDGF